MASEEDEKFPSMEEKIEGPQIPPYQLEVLEKVREVVGQFPQRGEEVAGDTSPEGVEIPPAPPVRDIVREVQEKTGATMTHNVVDVYTDGPTFFRELEREFLRARDHAKAGGAVNVHIDLCSWADDPAGRRMASALQKAVEAGARIALTVDQYGSILFGSHEKFPTKALWRSPAFLLRTFWEYGVRVDRAVKTLWNLFCASRDVSRFAALRNDDRQKVETIIRQTFPENFLLQCNDVMREFRKLTAAKEGFSFTVQTNALAAMDHRKAFAFQYRSSEAGGKDVLYIGGRNIGVEYSGGCREGPDGTPANGWYGRHPMPWHDHCLRLEGDAAEKYLRQRGMPRSEFSPLPSVSAQSPRTAREGEEEGILLQNSNSPDLSTLWGRVGRRIEERMGVWPRHKVTEWLRRMAERVQRKPGSRAQRIAMGLTAIAERLGGQQRWRRLDCSLEASRGEKQITYAVHTLLNTAQEVIYVDHAYLLDRAVVRKLMEAAERGVRVVLLIGKSEAEAIARAVERTLRKMEKKNASMRARKARDKLPEGLQAWRPIEIVHHGSISHAKTLCVDDYALTGSANLTRESLREHAEVAMLCHGTKAQQVLRNAVEGMIEDAREGSSDGL